MKDTSIWKKISVISFFLFLAAFSTAIALQPDKEVSRTERRSLAQLPEFSWESLLNGTYGGKVEDYLLDQFVGRDFLRTVKTEFETRVMGKSDSDGYFKIGDSVYKINEALEEKNIVWAATQFSVIRRGLFPEAQAYYAIIPDRNYFLTEASGMAYSAMDYERLNDLMKENMQGISYIDIYGCLELEDYYRTDLHWRQEKIIDVADMLLVSMQTAGVQKENYEQKVATDTFLGGYAVASAFWVEPEEINYLTSSAMEQASVYDYEKKETVPVYAQERLEGMDPYDFYLWGARALLTIENPAQESGEKLIIFRDSFGSSIAPLLLDGYSEITLVDLRYISPNYLKTVIDPSEYDTVLFLYSTELLNNSDSLKPYQ